MPAKVAATPTLSTSSAEALALLLLVACCRQRQEIDRLTAERAVLVETNQGLAAENE